MFPIRSSSTFADSTNDITSRSQNQDKFEKNRLEALKKLKTKLNTQNNAILPKSTVISTAKKNHNKFQFELISENEVKISFDSSCCSSSLTEKFPYMRKIELNENACIFSVSPTLLLMEKEKIIEMLKQKQNSSFVAFCKTLCEYLKYRN